MEKLSDTQVNIFNQQAGDLGDYPELQDPPVEMYNPLMLGICRAWASTALAVWFRDHGHVPPRVILQAINHGLLREEAIGIAKTGLIIPFLEFDPSNPDINLGEDIRPSDVLWDLTKEGEIALFAGMFDILNLGHIAFLEELKKTGKKLVCILSTDAECSVAKGENRPIFPLEYRAATLRVAGVDYILRASQDVVMYYGSGIPFPYLTQLGMYRAVPGEKGSSLFRMAIPRSPTAYINGLFSYGECKWVDVTQQDLENPEAFIQNQMPGIVGDLQYLHRTRKVTVYVTQGDPNMEIKRFTSLTAGFNFVEIPNHFPNVHSTDIIKKYGVRSLSTLEKEGLL